MQRKDSPLVVLIAFCTVGHVPVAMLNPKASTNPSDCCYTQDVFLHGLPQRWRSEYGYFTTDEAPLTALVFI